MSGQITDQLGVNLLHFTHIQQKLCGDEIIICVTLCLLRSEVTGHRQWTDLSELSLVSQELFPAILLILDQTRTITWKSHEAKHDVINLLHTGRC